MSEYTVHDLDSAPEAAKPLLENSIKGFGRVPNLHGVMAEAPALLEGYQETHRLAQQTSFSKEELTVVWQTCNVEHECHYCVPAHSMIAKAMGVDTEINDALRNETTLSNAKLEVLRSTTLAMLRERGRIDEPTTRAFFEAGFTRQNLLEIVLILSQKVMSNYVNHLAHTPIDQPFQAYEWKRAAVT